MFVGGAASFAKQGCSRLPGQRHRRSPRHRGHAEAGQQFEVVWQPCRRRRRRREARPWFVQEGCGRDAGRERQVPTACRVPVDAAQKCRRRWSRRIEWTGQRSHLLIEQVHADRGIGLGSVVHLLDRIEPAAARTQVKSRCLSGNLELMANTLPSPVRGILTHRNTLRVSYVQCSALATVSTLRSPLSDPSGLSTVARE